MPSGLWRTSERRHVELELLALLEGVGDPDIEALFDTDEGLIETLCLLRALSPDDMALLPPNLPPPQGRAAKASRVYRARGILKADLLAEDR